MSKVSELTVTQFFVVNFTEIFVTITNNNSQPQRCSWELYGITYVNYFLKPNFSIRAL